MSYTAEIISVGTELLLGDIVDTDSLYISRGLSDLGINLFHRETVGDNSDRLSRVLKSALLENDIVITTGGLGATADDLTKETVAKLLDIPLVMHDETLRRIKDYYKKRKREMTDNNRKQALIPEGATVFENDYGTAPALAVEKEGKTVIMLPGPPRELFPIFDEKIKPYLKKRFSDSVIKSRRLYLFGIPESALEEKVLDLMSEKNPTLAPYAKTGDVELRLTAKGKDESECDTLLDALEEKVVSRVGEFIYTNCDTSLEEATSRIFREKGLTLAFAESLTGGLVAKRIIDVPGASKIIGLSLVTYSAEAKMKMLSVSPETIEKDGVISAKCAKEMAEGLYRLSSADVAVSLTGVAGPDSEEGHEIGTVFIGVASKRGCRTVELHLARGKKEREYIRALSANHALNEARLEALSL